VGSRRRTAVATDLARVGPGHARPHQQDKRCPFRALPRAQSASLVVLAVLRTGRGLDTSLPHPQFLAEPAKIRAASTPMAPHRNLDFFRLPESSRSTYWAFAGLQTVMLAVLVLVGSWAWRSHQADLAAQEEASMLDQSQVVAVASALTEVLSPWVSASASISGGPEFTDPGAAKDDSLLRTVLSPADAARLANLNVLGTILESPDGPARRFVPNQLLGSGSLEVWQLTRGLPQRFHGRSPAASRRTALATVASRYQLQAAAEVDELGRVVLMAPYSRQLSLREWSLLDEIPGLRRVGSREGTAMLPHAAFMGHQGSFLTFATPIPRGAEPGHLLLLVADRPSSIDSGRAFMLLDQMGAEILRSAGWSPGASTLTQSTTIGGIPTRLVVDDEPSSHRSQTARRLVLLGALAAGFIFIATRQYASLLMALDDPQEKRVEDITRLQNRIDGLRRTLQEKAQRLAHDFRNRALGLRHFQNDWLERMSADEATRLNGLINDIDKYAGDLSLKLVPEALGYDKVAPVQTYLAGALDTVVRQFRASVPLRVSVRFQGDTTERTPFVRVPASDLSRILSNVLLNSVEATANIHSPRIGIIVDHHGDMVSVRVEDNGSGIDSASQIAIFSDGFTTKGGEGRGNGLPSARERASRAGGDVRLVSSVLGQGTTMEIVLPWIDTPPWFTDTFQLRNTSVVAIVDDEDLAFDYWEKTIQGKFSFTLKGATLPELLHFNSPAALKGASKGALDRITHFLVDQHFDTDTQTGLDLIQALGIQERATLVTNLFEAPAVIEEAQRLGIKILPKTFVLNARISILLEH
jgi:signal transduction histidine kinase